MSEFSLDRRESSTDHWISVSDMMSGLMVVFLFISISYMIHVQSERAKVRDLAIAYNEIQKNLDQELYEAFRDSLQSWRAEFEHGEMAITFTAPDVLFRRNSAVVRPRFQEILTVFFPRFVEIVTKDCYKAEIAEIRIEGHTSSEWHTNVSPEEAYYRNMELSQARTRSVLRYVLSLDSVSAESAWLKEHLTANGLSSSKPVILDGVEDKTRSRRVQFRVRTNAQRRMVKILEESGADI